MKKLLLLLFVFPFIFSSCGSDDDKDKEVVPPLKSTVWEGTQDNIKATVTFSELESTMVLSVLNISKSAAYTYTYEHPKVIMYPKETGNAKMEGTVSSDYKTMVLVNTSTGKTIATLTKK